MQGYNAQATVNEKQIVLAAEISVESPDFGHLEPMVDATIRRTELRVQKFTPCSGERSFGGRMTSQAQAASPLAGVRGLVFVEPEVCARVHMQSPVTPPQRQHPGRRRVERGQDTEGVEGGREHRDLVRRGDVQRDEEGAEHRGDGLSDLGVPVRVRARPRGQ